MRYHYLQGITDVVVEEAERLLGFNRNVVVYSSKPQERLIRKRYPELANKITFRRAYEDS